MRYPPPTEHGTSMYRRMGCRCDICKAANAAKKKKYTKLAPPQVLLDGALFVAIIERAGRLREFDYRQIDRWRDNGVNVYTADFWCTKLGYHPTEVFGSDFYRGCFDEEYAA
jgi:hypothetical protein